MNYSTELQCFQYILVFIFSLVHGEHNEEKQTFIDPKHAIFCLFVIAVANGLCL